MGRTVAMQPWTTLEGNAAGGSTEAIVQPAELWIDGQEVSDVALDILITRMSGATGSTLVIETAMSPAGPWSDLTTFTSGYAATTYYCTTRENGTNKFKRFIRWRFARAAAATDWKLCFRICATMK